MLLSRRSAFVFVVFSVFAAALLVASRRLSAQCPGGAYCPDFSKIQSQLSPDGSTNSKQEHKVEKPADKPATSSPDTDETSADDDHDGDNGAKPASPCDNFPDTSDLLLIMKTGASEAYAKVPTQLMNNLQCLPEYYIFSDLEQNIAGHKLYDSLDQVRIDIRAGNKDFLLYWRQKVCAVDQQHCHTGYDLGKEGWALDKYKFVHVAEKTYRMRPNYKWYVFTEADTYVVWSNIVDWLKRLDPTRPMYFGSVAMLGGKPFGHGGTGYVMSHAAMRDMFEGKTGVANKYDDKMPHTCCGDAIFAEAVLNETGVKIQHTWPTMNGEKPNTIPYADDQWCEPIATMHHVSSEEVNDFAAYERQLGFKGPIRIKDLYKRFVQPHLRKTRNDWNNFSEDEVYLNSTSREYNKDLLKKAGEKKGKLSALQEAAHESFEACGKACESLDYCFQYRFNNGVCGIGKKIRHGEPAKPDTDENKQFKSGWNMDKITQWVEKHENCKEVKWPNPK